MMYFELASYLRDRCCYIPVFEAITLPDPEELVSLRNHAPTDAAELQEKDNFHRKLNAVVHKVPKGDIRICIGDFNAKISFDNTDYERFMIRHGLGEMREKGELFAERDFFYYRTNWAEGS